MPVMRKEDRVKSDPVPYSANPRWNQTMLFYANTLHDLDYRELEISVWCYCNKSTKNVKTCLGGMRLSMKSTGLETKASPGNSSLPLYSFLFFSSPSLSLSLSLSPSLHENPIPEENSKERILWTQLMERHNMWVYGEIPLRPI